MVKFIWPSSLLLTALVKINANTENAQQFLSHHKNLPNHAKDMLIKSLKTQNELMRAWNEVNQAQNVVMKNIMKYDQQARENPFYDEYFFDQMLASKNPTVAGLASEVAFTPRSGAGLSPMNPYAGGMNMKWVGEDFWRWGTIKFFMKA